MKILKTAKYKKLALDMNRYESEGMMGEPQYKSDQDISSEFSNMKIREIQVKDSGSSGWIELFFPEAGEHVGGGAEEVVDRWIKYDHNGKIAFENWYPEEVYLKLVGAIENKLRNQISPQDTPMGLENDNPVEGIDY